MGVFFSELGDYRTKSADKDPVEHERKLGTESPLACIWLQRNRTFLRVWALIQDDCPEYAFLYLRPLQERKPVGYGWVKERLPRTKKNRKAASGRAFSVVFPYYTHVCQSLLVQQDQKRSQNSLLRLGYSQGLSVYSTSFIDSLIVSQA